MEKDSLGQKILEWYARNELELLKDTVSSSLASHRPKALGTLESILASADGKLRMALLEILIKDGGADLIPLFIETIRTEKNLLYAKSQILLYKEFRHQRALGALLSIEDEIDIELKSTYQRTLGRLLSQFSEQFYMSEFLAGVGDPRRVQFAADMMLRSPHADYLPFLADRVLENDIGYRSEGVRVLQSLGDGPSNDALFTMLGRLRRQMDQGNRLDQALQANRTSLSTFFLNLVTQAQLNWTDAERSAAFAAVNVGEGEDVLGQILDGFHVAGEVRKKIKPYLKGILCGGEPSAFQVSRSRAAMETYLAEMATLQLQTIQAMGAIADRAEDTQFLTRLDHFLPAEDPHRDALMIASLAGYRKPASETLLVEYVNTCSEPEILEQALKALEHYPLAAIPRGVEKLCFDEQNGVLRRHAVDLVAKWGFGASVAKTLMESSSLAVCADGVRIAAEHKLQDCFPLLLALLKKQIPDSLLVAVLEAFAAFPGATTGRAIKPFLIPPYTLTVRRTALTTCFRAGGEDRLDIIVRTLAQGQTKGDELLDMFLNLMTTESFEDRENFLLGERDFWLRLLTAEFEPYWPKVLHLIESLPLKGPYQARPWMIGLKKITAGFSGELSAMQRRMVALAHSLEETVEHLTVQERGTKQLHVMLDTLKTTNPFQRTQAMRNLVRNFPEELVLSNETALNQIIDLVQDELGQKDPVKDTLLQAIALAGLVGHPRLHSRLKRLLEFPNIDVRSAVKTALETPIRAQFSRPIQSIYIIDDSRYITKQLSKVLAQAGYSVDFENDPELGLKRLGERRFELLLLDVIMPQMGGADFLKEARQRGHSPDYTLVVTSSRSREELNPVLSLGVDGVLLKPFRMEELLMRIKELVGS